MRHERQHRGPDHKVAVGRVHEEEPRPPLLGPCQEHARIVRHRQEPHELVVDIRRRERDGRHRDDQEHRDTMHRRHPTRVFTEGHIGGDRQERRADEMPGSTD